MNTSTTSRNADCGIENDTHKEAFEPRWQRRRRLHIAQVIGQFHSSRVLVGHVAFVVFFLLIVLFASNLGVCLQSSSVSQCMRSTSWSSSSFHRMVYFACYKYRHEPSRSSYEPIYESLLVISISDPSVSSTRGNPYPSSPEGCACQSLPLRKSEQTFRAEADATAAARLDRALDAPPKRWRLANHHHYRRFFLPFYVSSLETQTRCVVANHPTTNRRRRRRRSAREANAPRPTHARHPIER
jgi:hypothetical protein